MNLTTAKPLISCLLAGALTCCLAATAMAASVGVGTVTASALKLRSAASTTSSCLTLLAQDATVVVEDDSVSGWYKVNYNGQIGYLSADYVSLSTTSSAKIGNGLVTGDTVNVRSGAGTASSKVATLDEGDVVAIVGMQDGWYKVSFAGTTGYVSSDYMTVTKEALSSRGTTASSASNSGNSSIVAYAKNYLGIHYVYGGASSSGFDCSGFTMYVMKHFGYSLPHTATGQLSCGTSVAKSNLQPGDLVFFRDTTITSKAASHVGIYIGNNQFIHASSGGGKVQIDSLSKAYYSTYYVGARRLG